MEGPGQLSPRRRATGAVALRYRRAGGGATGGTGGEGIRGGSDVIRPAQQSSAREAALTDRGCRVLPAGCARLRTFHRLVRSSQLASAREVTWPGTVSP